MFHYLTLCKHPLPGSYHDDIDRPRSDDTHVMIVIILDGVLPTVFAHNANGETSPYSREGRSPPYGAEVRHDAENLSDIGGRGVIP